MGHAAMHTQIPLDASAAASAQSPFLERILSGGVEPGDSEDLQLNKSLLVFATGLVCTTMMLWTFIYSLLGQHFPVDIPMLFTLLLAGNLAIYLWSRRFDIFRLTQLGLLLFLPFVAQWAAGNLVVSSGAILWGLLAPIGAILCIGARESLGWFIAWGVLTALSGAADYYLADMMALQATSVPLRVSLLFFTLNFLSVAAISYGLLLFSIEQKRRIQERLEKSRCQLQIANDAAQDLLRGPIMFI